MESIKSISGTDLTTEMGTTPVQKSDDSKSLRYQATGAGKAKSGSKTTTVTETGKVPVDFGKLTENINNYVQSIGTKLSFKYDESVSHPIIIVRDQETGEVIRQIPPEEMLTLLEKLKDINGILFRGEG